MTIEWISEAPTHCDLCGAEISNVFIDGRTKFGHWGKLCPLCHALHGVGLGTGFGQKYRLHKETGRWLKEKI